MPAPAGALDLAAFRGKRFVLVEDDRMVAEALREALADHGIETQSFATAEEALAAPALLHADYFIVDHQLAGRMNGCDFLDALSRRAAAPPRAVVITGNTREDFVKELRGRAWPHLFKPADLESILAALVPEAPPAGA